MMVLSGKFFNVLIILIISVFLEMTMYGLSTFKLEEYLGRYEFEAPYLLCCSDAESMGMAELLEMANQEELKLWNSLKLGYTEVQGHPLLRRAIAQYLYQGLNAENIFTFAGAEDAIFCALTALCEPQDHVIVVTPCYQSLLEVPKSRGCSVTQVVLREEQGWQLNIEEIRSAIIPQTKAVVINFPHNPTGQILTPALQQALVDLLREQNIWLFADEVYLGLSPDASPQKLLPVALLYERAISLGVMSKSFGLAGLRIGWVACQNVKILSAIGSIKHYTSICNSAPAEILALIALRNKDKLWERNNAIIQNNFALLGDFLDRHSTMFSWVPSGGGCTGLIRYRGNMGIEEFCNRVIKEAGVLLLPATVYGMQEPFFRIGFGRASMPEVLAIFETWINKQPIL